MIGIGEPDAARTVDRQIARKIDALSVERGPKCGGGAIGFHLDDPTTSFLAAVEMSIGRQRQTACPVCEATDLVDAATIRIVTEETAFENRGKDDGLPVPDEAAGRAAKGAGDAFEFPRHQTAPAGMPGIFSRVRNTQLRVVV